MSPRSCSPERAGKWLDLIDGLQAILGDYGPAPDDVVVLNGLGRPIHIRLAGLVSDPPSRIRRGLRLLDCVRLKGLYHAYSFHPSVVVIIRQLYQRPISPVNRPLSNLRSGRLNTTARAAEQARAMKLRRFIFSSGRIAASSRRYRPGYGAG